MVRPRPVREDASTAMARPKPPRSEREKSTATEEEAARERSLKGWEALHALERTQFAFSWWPGQESE
eukprot:10835877-Prorocentrum_lima.AAC.1